MVIAAVVRFVLYETDPFNSLSESLMSHNGHSWPKFTLGLTLHAMRILLVEDHLELSHWLSKALRDANLTVETATNGADADALLHTQDYALVILDLTLPKMDGLDVLRRLRARGGPRAKTPVLILTARGGLE